jgi:hypothetical protein
MKTRMTGKRRGTTRRNRSPTAGEGKRPVGDEGLHRASHGAAVTANARAPRANRRPAAGGAGLR